MVQIGSLLFAAWIVLWIVAASVVSAVFFVRYIGIVEDNQAWYLQHGSARSAAAETTAVLQAAIEAKEALIASINYGSSRPATTTQQLKAPGTNTSATALRAHL